ncbi:hypothetical protein P171DRAFT_85797 [Karstenula rhodostoma CBS 690.94]|uniref:CFEM domain-containing protein n=1 Tax=Karstenula rhodostoma CBS 690.94 TaxID=1392251 RepID=A0A9P4PDF5_9PLEO|nr:hypothetical protein P171DRAFT_85797 [Karstenula rhodostoma CBS 690.94]
MRRLDAILLFSSFIYLALSVPLIHSIPNGPSVPFDPLQLRRPHPPQPSRQAEPLKGLRIPDCALSCYLQGLPYDGCAQEIDLKCHCSTGNLLGKAAACVEANCSMTNQADANRKVTQACQAVGIILSFPGSSAASSASPSSRAPSTEAATTTPPMGYSMASTSSAQTTAMPPQPSNDQPSGLISSSLATQTTAASSSAELMSPLPSQWATSAPTSTGTSLSVPVSDGGLSDGAKAGISVSVLFAASTVFIALSLYIRRLKRQLALATAAANVPDSVLRSPTHRHSGIPEALLTPSRRRSWPNAPRNRRLSRGEYLIGSPVSPLSPVFFRDGGRRTSIAGMLHNKRGNVLSVVIEHEDEDASSLVSRGRSIREPVPGQSEGLAGPLEMDGQFAAIFEAPTSITPRARSTERNKEEQEWKD